MPSWQRSAEGHRGQYGAVHAKMRKTRPNACFVGFTGTPKEKTPSSGRGRPSPPPQKFRL
jgi:type I site-specific restriction-modification system R (restriction) subunit